MAQSINLVWFRRDLRLHDHPALTNAIATNQPVIAFYCFDPREFSSTSFGFKKTGPLRAQFLLASVENLRTNLRQLGAELIVAYGYPERIIPELAQQYKVQRVYYHQEATPEELAIEQALAHQLRSLGVTSYPLWASTLYDPEDLPLALQDLPELFTKFRQQIEAKATVREPLPTPARINSLTIENPGRLPTLQELGFNATESRPDPRTVMVFMGGETNAQARLHTYFWERDRLKEYKETRNAMVGPDYSSKFSPWLALGCLSPRYIYVEVKRYEQERIKNDSTYWLIFELLWRDYFRWIALKHGYKLFRPGGLRGIKLPWREDPKQFEIWRSGHTGYPLVDANMQELALTGFMSNRGRQNVASFLTKNLGINWMMGAEWFESQLLDYDPCSNWGNWNYTAGIGNDARGFRYFNIPKQSQTYDRDGQYLRLWLPALSQIPGEKIHQPWQLTQTEQRQWGVSIGQDYPKPMVDFFSSVKRNQKIYEQAIKQ